MKKYVDFKTTTYGKWILTGEHAVLRGHGALVFPVFSKSLTLHYTPSQPGLRIHVVGEQCEGMDILFKRVLAHGMGLVGRSLSDVAGDFHVGTTLPIGVGMGASAALCVAVARWFLYKQWIEEGRLLLFATELEHLFHGKSSGLDIVGAAATTGQYFKNGHAEPVLMSWQPCWLLSFCGEKSMTSNCIDKVQALWNDFPKKATMIDKNMNDSVEKARRALVMQEEAGRSLLIESMHQAASCFREWGLINDALDTHMQALLKAGAVAVKPTGSGGGGYILSLWYNEMPCDVDKEQNKIWITAS